MDLVTALGAAGLPTQAAIRGNAGRQAALAAAGVATTILPFGGPFDFSTRGGVARTAQAMGARVMVAWMSRAARHAPAGPWRRIGRLGGYYDLKYYRGFDALVGNTRDICDWIAGQGWPAERVNYIPNFAEAGDAAPVDRATMGTPEGVPLLLGMGRLHPSKAHDVSLAALARIPDAWLWIAGSGPIEAELKAKASELGVADRVRFLGWRSDAGALYRTADVCVFPSRYEPLLAQHRASFQAWAYGLAVVAAASKGPASLIHDGEDGRPHADRRHRCVRLGGARADRRPIVARKARRSRPRAASAQSSRANAVVAQWRALFEATGDASCAA